MNNHFFCLVLVHLIPCVFILVSWRVITSLLTTSCCYQLKLIYIFILYPFFQYNPHGFCILSNLCVVST